MELERAAGFQLSAEGRRRMAGVSREITKVLRRQRAKNEVRLLRSVSWCWAQLALFMQSELSKAEFARLETAARKTVQAPAEMPGWQVLAVGLDKRALYTDLSRWLRPVASEGLPLGWICRDPIFFDWFPRNLGTLPGNMDRVMAATELTRRFDPPVDDVQWNKPKGVPFAVALRKFWGELMFGKLVHIWRVRYNPPPNTSDEWLVSCLFCAARVPVIRVAALYRKICQDSGFQPPQLEPLSQPELLSQPRPLAQPDLSPQEDPTAGPETAAKTDVALEARTAFLERRYTDAGRPDAVEAAKIDAAAIQADLVERRTALLARLMSGSDPSEESSLSDPRVSQLTEFVYGWLQTVLREVNGNGVVLVPVNFSMCCWRWLLLAGVMIEKMDGDRLQGLLSQAETVIPRPKNVGKQWYLACVLEDLISSSLMNIWLSDVFNLTEPNWYSRQTLYVEYFPHNQPVSLRLGLESTKLVSAACTAMHWLACGETMYHERNRFDERNLTWIETKQDEPAKQIPLELGEPLFRELVGLWRDLIPAPETVTDCQYVSSFLKLSPMRAIQRMNCFKSWKKIGTKAQPIMYLSRKRNKDDVDMPLKKPCSSN
ncbi:hypothetical protein GNI_011910 [Gregarina niphandrodes]|uniref:Uncharacterized protein n=1 Tax=Gregarina niphandrodes TaxID=110365 RepID=A0A023BCM4_GRENI|nr:hypothetical protein GNI_011910 [Gregarina niphandrodes]EZG85282.1 hypothetical protein GNI_011910 [Gregarina niphandrodes]|eukprot:XP_011128833.1 hypothetical protein GNI_011910 [Gregarina niphandrodes]